jgi:RimJ/RimL family protein N-acetyltransferase
MDARDAIVICGEGIELRPLTVDDAEAHKAGEDAAQIAAFEFPGPAPIENVVAAIGAWQASWAADGPVRNFGIWETASGALCGNTEVRRLAWGRVNLSYLVFPSFRRRGFATQAARLALDYAASEMGATTATIKVLTWNEASIGVARALGAVDIGREASEAGGTFVVFELSLRH